MTVVYKKISLWRWLWGESENIHFSLRETSTGFTSCFVLYTCIICRCKYVWCTHIYTWVWETLNTLFSCWPHENDGVQQFFYLTKRFLVETLDLSSVLSSLLWSLYFVIQQALIYDILDTCHCLEREGKSYKAGKDGRKAFYPLCNISQRLW